MRAVSRDETLVERVRTPSRRTELPPRLAAILRYAERLACAPPAVTEADARELRDALGSDEAMLHVVQVVAYFSFVNRLAQGLGVELED